MKIDVPKLFESKWVGVVIAIGTGLIATIGAIQEQQDEREYEELKNRVAELEKLTKGSK